jgi:hypothetical protein
MTTALNRLAIGMEYDTPGEPFATMQLCKDGSYIDRDELKERLQKALTSASPVSAQADAFREVIAWLGED